MSGSYPIPSKAPSLSLTPKEVAVADGCTVTVRRELFLPHAHTQCTTETVLLWRVQAAPFLLGHCFPGSLQVRSPGVNPISGTFVLPLAF